MSPGGFYADPHEVIVRVGSFRLSYYAILAHAGFIVGSVMALRRARRTAPTLDMLPVLLAIYLGAVVGARAFSVLFDGHLSAYLRHPSKMLEFWKGGLVLYGGLLGGGLAGIAAARLQRSPVGGCADALAPGIAVGLAIGRIGCFLAGCCYGTPTLSPLGLQYRDFALPVRPIGVPLHPAPLYESAGLLVIGLWLWFRPPQRRPPGDRFVLFLALYALLRFFVEYLRADPRGAIAGLSTSQLISLLVGPTAAFLLLWRRWRYRHSHSAVT